MKRLVTASIVAVLICCNSANAQFRTVAFGIHQKPNLDGTMSYELFARQVGYEFFGVPRDGGTLTAPNGTVVQSPIGPPLVFGSFADLGATLFGDWTAVEHPTSGADRTYTIRVAPFAASGALTIAPVITSPPSGATVPPDFVVKWTPNIQTTSRGISFDAPGVTVGFHDREFGVDGFFSVGLHTQLLAAPPVPFTVRAAFQVQLRDPTIPSRSPSLNGETINTILDFSSMSLPATYQVVPEPFAITLSVAGGAILLLARRRRSCASCR